MVQAAFIGKERIGRITLERFNDSLRLRWMLERKSYSLTPSKDTKEGLKIARAKAQAIDSDIALGSFDPTLEKYGKAKRTNLYVVPDQPVETKLRELWDKFLADKLLHLKPKTQDEYANFSALLDKLGDDLMFDALSTKQALLRLTTVDQTRRMLMYLSACCKWAVRHKLIQDNPFEGMASELPKRQSATDPVGDSFTEQERDAVIAAFRNDCRPGMNYSHYADIVEFWFLTGCRPSEAIGLSWDNVADDCYSVTFNGSISTIKGKQVFSKGSKNNKSRTIAISSRAAEILLSRKTDSTNPTDLVFPSPKSNAINYPNFQSKIWGKVVDPIKPNTTPYNCRDTFINMQLFRGISSTVIAKWCDTSTQQIDCAYADSIKLRQIRPLD